MRQVGASAPTTRLAGYHGRIAAVQPGSVSAIAEDEKARWVVATKPVHDKWIADVKAKGLDGEALIKSAQDMIAKYSQA